jgi:hypothetical protein
MLSSHSIGVKNLRRDYFVQNMRLSNYIKAISTAPAYLRKTLIPFNTQKIAFRLFQNQQQTFRLCLDAMKMLNQAKHLFSYKFNQSFSSLNRTFAVISKTKGKSLSIDTNQSVSGVLQNRDVFKFLSLSPYSTANNRYKYQFYDNLLFGHITVLFSR